MTRHHVIISGTGRAGTTFLVQLLTALKLDTGFGDINEMVEPNCRAGMEKNLREETAPYIIKSPWLCDYLDEILDEQPDIVIDRAIIPVRDLFSAAESRRHVVRTANSELDGDLLWGGLWHTKDPSTQEVVLTGQLYKLFYALAKHDIPATLLFFPRLATDPKYLYDKISFLLKKPGRDGAASRLLKVLHNDTISYDAFLQTFQKISRPEIIHSFTPGNS